MSVSLFLSQCAWGEGMAVKVVCGRMCLCGCVSFSLHAYTVALSQSVLCIDGQTDVGQGSHSEGEGSVQLAFL